ncbi:hypothetical protein MXB_3987 [Myxobolus squamalis]|nr:hypothetical protein MXB_3987 [Myxobolus squamalis]
MSNEFWGWGREDDDLYKRLEKYKLSLHRIKDVGNENFPFFIHDHPHSEKRDLTNILHNSYTLQSGNFGNGLTTLKYELLKIEENTTQGWEYKIINVKLICTTKYKIYC